MVELRMRRLGDLNRPLTNPEWDDDLPEDIPPLDQAPTKQPKKRARAFRPTTNQEIKLKRLQTPGEGKE